MSAKWTLVTGANGFVGARLVRQLVEKGEKVKAFVRAGADLRELEGLPRDQVRIAVGDIRIVDRVFAGLRGCDRLYHVAANFSMDEKERYRVLDDTVLGAESTLEAARRAGIEKIVFTSSAATLGASASSDPMDESDAFNLSSANSYSEAKHAAERIALECAAQGMPIVIVNPSLIVGPGDWKPTPSGAQIVEYLGLSPSFRVPTMPGGFSIVDVDDVARGHIAAMEKGKIGERYILGGENLSHHEFYTLLADVTGLSEPGAEISREKASLFATVSELVSWWNSRPPLLTRKMVQNYYGQYVFVSSEKAQRELGYEPRAAREALSRACRWYLDHGYVSPAAARRARLELRPAHSELRTA
jgi:dihydroflavonol-4-reductase